jgi:hypothetical protein
VVPLYSGSDSPRGIARQEEVLYYIDKVVAGSWWTEGDKAVKGCCTRRIPFVFHHAGSMLLLFLIQGMHTYHI